MNNDSVNLALAVARLGHLKRILEGLTGILVGLWTVAAMGLLWVALDPSDPSRLFHAAVLFALYPGWVWARAVASALAHLASR